MKDIAFPFENQKQQKFIQIDEDGYFLLNGIRTTENEFGKNLLDSLVKDDKNRFFVETNNVWACVEAFDEPYVAEMVQKLEGPQWSILLPYGLEKKFSLSTLCVDEWDRFHGRCTNGIPFVFSRKAQAAFFDLVDAFEDDAFIVNGTRYETHPWLSDSDEAGCETFWTQIYKNEPHPPFDLGAPAKALEDISAQLKLNKMRVAVIGAGKGHDAAFFAKQGHLVTAFDISPEAIHERKNLYGDLKNLEFIEADILNLDKKYFSQFDLVFEHTCYCALPPKRRNDLVKVWKQLLAAEGHVLGIFFAMDKPNGPPFGGSEWELRERFKKYFDFLYWTRWKNSIPRRLGKE
ncbi:MAG: methyltransferase domain-containing protein, partial [Bdellovibrionales bacterium]|nr:methyltransferase domain-containing protein [Bdellovibrionales bacterium]